MRQRQLSRLWAVFVVLPVPTSHCSASKIGSWKLPGRNENKYCFLHPFRVGQNARDTKRKKMLQKMNRSWMHHKTGFDFGKSRFSFFFSLFVFRPTWVQWTVLANFKPASRITAKTVKNYKIKLWSLWPNTGRRRPFSVVLLYFLTWRIWKLNA